MKRIIYLLLIAVATIGVSCSRGYNQPDNPYEDGRTHSGGNNGGRTEGDNPSVDNPQDRNPAVCDDYYNRYQLVDNVNIFLSEYGTLYWYNSSVELCPKICWADLSLRREGYYLTIYRLVRGEMREMEVYDCRESFYEQFDILLCDPENPDYIYQRKIRVSHSSSAAVLVELLSIQNSYSVDERFFM